MNSWSNLQNLVESEGERVVEFDLSHASQLSKWTWDHTTQIVNCEVQINKLFELTQQVDVVEGKKMRSWRFWTFLVDKNGEGIVQKIL